MNPKCDHCGGTFDENPETPVVDCPECGGDFHDGICFDEHDCDEDEADGEFDG